MLLQRYLLRPSSAPRLIRDPHQPALRLKDLQISFRFRGYRYLSGSLARLLMRFRRVGEARMHARSGRLRCSQEEDHCHCNSSSSSLVIYENLDEPIRTRAKRSITVGCCENVPPIYLPCTSWMACTCTCVLCVLSPADLMHMDHRDTGANAAAISFKGGPCLMSISASLVD